VFIKKLEPENKIAQPILRGDQILSIKKTPHPRGFFIRGKKVVFQKLVSTGDSGIGKTINNILALVFATAIKGIKNGKVRITKKLVKNKRKGSRNTPLFNP
jgi:hypothetical protein